MIDAGLPLVTAYGVCHVDCSAGLTASLEFYPQGVFEAVGLLIWGPPDAVLRSVQLGPIEYLQQEAAPVSVFTPPLIMRDFLRAAFIAWRGLSRDRSPERIFIVGDRLALPPSELPNLDMGVVAGGTRCTVICSEPVNGILVWGRELL